MLLCRMYIRFLDVMEPLVLAVMSKAQELVKNPERKRDYLQNRKEITEQKN